MKSFFKILGLLLCIFLINSCAALSGASVWAANTEIGNSVLSAENENFQKESGINLTIIKRGLWSMQSTFNSNLINSYFRALMENRLVYSLNNRQTEYVRQTLSGDNINVEVNNRFLDFSEYERAIILIASTSALALMQGNSYDRNEVQRMFFNFIDSYIGTGDISNITNSLWYRNKNITIGNNGIIIG